jgi:hypothetical protein
MTCDHPFITRLITSSGNLYRCDICKDEFTLSPKPCDNPSCVACHGRVWAGSEPPTCSSKKVTVQAAGLLKPERDTYTKAEIDERFGAVEEMLRLVATDLLGSDDVARFRNRYLS